MASLQDQFMKAGLVSKGKAKQLNQDKSRQQKLDRKSGVQTVDEAKLAAQEIQRQQAERARELNAQRDAAARQKAIEAQIVQMIQQHKQAKLTRGARAPPPVSTSAALPPAPPSAMPSPPLLCSGV